MTEHVNHKAFCRTLHRVCSILWMSRLNPDPSCLFRQCTIYSSAPQVSACLLIEVQSPFVLISSSSTPHSSFVGTGQCSASLLLVEVVRVTPLVADLGYGEEDISVLAHLLMPLRVNSGSRLSIFPFDVL